MGIGRCPRRLVARRVERNRRAALGTAVFAGAEVVATLQTESAHLAICLELAAELKKESPWSEGKNEQPEPNSY
jgi:hypothetical protein